MVAPVSNLDLLLDLVCGGGWVVVVVIESYFTAQPKPKLNTTLKLISLEMARLFHWPSSSSLASLLLITVLLLSFVSTSLCRSPYSSCLRSCHHCKEMYGRNFSGHRCARTCIKRKGNFKAVCTDLHSIKNFLDLASLVDYDWAESNGI